MPHRIEKLLKIIAPILVANQIGKKIIFTGNGFGPFGNKSAQFLSGFFCSLNNVTFYCRDNLYSPMWLRQIGVAPQMIANVPDDLQFPHRSFQNKKCPVSKTKYIVLETYLPIEYIQNNIETFRLFSKKLYDNYKLDIVFLPFNLAWGGMDQGIFLKDELNHFELFDINKPGYLRIEDALSIIKKAELIVCSRYHALVVALSVKTPAVSVLRNIAGDKRYHYNKNGGLLRNFFAGIPINENNYIRLDYSEALNYAVENLPEIISTQKENYETQAEQSDIGQKMLDQRKNLFLCLKSS